jgi:hypothetical protein
LLSSVRQVGAAVDAELRADRETSICVKLPESLDSCEPGIQNRAVSHSRPVPEIDVCEKHIFERAQHTEQLTPAGSHVFATIDDDPDAGDSEPLIFISG